MMNKNSYLNFTLINGEKVKVTLTFGKLNLLKSVNNSLYQRFCKILNGSSKEILDLATVIYVAYWCANYGNEDLMTEDDFLNSTPFDISEIKRVFLALTQPKKKTDLENRS